MPTKVIVLNLLEIVSVPMQPNTNICSKCSLVNTYPGRPGYTSTTVAAIVAQIPFSSLPDATYVSTLTSSNDSLPLANGTRTDCSSYVDGKDFQLNLSKTSWTTSCEAVAQIWGVTLDELGYWNPSLGNTSLPTCALEPGYQYCAVWYYSTSEPTATLGAILPIRVRSLALVYSVV